MDCTVYWIWLSLACTPGTATFPKLIDKFGNAKNVYDASIKDIIRCIDPRSSDRIKLSDKSLDKATEIFEFCNKKEIGMLVYEDDEYPLALRKIKSPPVMLYYRGRLPDFNSGFYASVVGTRSISDYGRRNAFKISYDLASAGATIVSGMAMGIDGVAHAAALEADKLTVAVLGSGIDICYPAPHLTLARNIVKHGCIITEFPPHTPPAKNNFPTRNRLISGLSAITIVIEGKERSGARITAACAIEQGKDVYALPGNIGSQNSEVTSLLLKNGAKALTCADDIIRDYQDKYPGVLNPFNMAAVLPVDVMSTLARYSVVAVAPDDDVFPAIKGFKNNRGPSFKKINTVEKEDRHNTIHMVDDSAIESKFDNKTFNIYKRIPISGECSVEFLIDSDTTLREVMKSLISLEMGGFVDMLPGDRVSRKMK